MASEPEVNLQSTQDIPTPPTPNPLVQGWETLAKTALSLLGNQQPPPVPQSPQTITAPTTTSPDPSAEYQTPSDPVLQAWQEVGLSTADVQGVLEAIPALPAGLRDDYEAALILARDPDFQKYKNDPEYIERLRSNLSSMTPIYAPGLPPSSKTQSPEFTFPPNFPGWADHANEPFYSMDQRELGRYLAVMGGEGN